MRILLLMQRFEPEPFLRGLLFAKELKKRGHDVQVLTSFPNYPGGKIYPGYKVRLFQREIMEGVVVNRVPIFPSHDRSSIKRVLTYLSFALSAALLGPFLIKKVDVVYAYHPPGTIALPAFTIKLLHRAALVYDIQDFWPETLQATGMLNNKMILRAVGKWMSLVYKGVDRIAVLSPGFKKLLLSKGIAESKIDVIYNWTNEHQIKKELPDASLAEKLGFNKRFNIVFAGNMGKAQALTTILDVAASVQTKIPKVHFTFVGDGVEKISLIEYAKENQLNNVTFLERQPMSEIGKIMSLADALLVHLKDDELFEITVPSKTQAYLFMGIPIVMAVKGDAAQLLEKANGGFTCEPENKVSIEEAIIKLTSLPSDKLDEMGLSVRAFYMQELSVEAGVTKFEEVFKNALNA